MAVRPREGDPTSGAPATRVVERSHDEVRELLCVDRQPALDLDLDAPDGPVPGRGDVSRDGHEHPAATFPDAGAENAGVHVLGVERCGRLYRGRRLNGRTGR